MAENKTTPQVDALEQEFRASRFDNFEQFLIATLAATRRELRDLCPDPQSVKVDGVHISRDLFRHMADSADEGKIFRLVRAADETGTVLLENPGYLPDLLTAEIADFHAKCVCIACGDGALLCTNCPDCKTALQELIKATLERSRLTDKGAVILPATAKSST